MVKSKRGAKAKKVKLENDIKPEVKEEVVIETMSDAVEEKEDKSKVKKETKEVIDKKSKEWRYFSKSDKNKKEKPVRGVVYVSSLPHGFYEKQLEGYFGQFGKVSGVYVPKSKKTGRAKGYGFVEFVHPEVAQVAAETMNNYLMFNRLIKTKVIPPEKQRPYMFSDRFKKKKHQYSESKVMQAVRKRRGLIAKQRDSYVTRSVRKLTRLQESLKSIGVDYKIKVAGINETVKLTGLNKIDPENQEIISRLKQNDSTSSGKEAASSKKKGKKSNSSKVAPTPSLKSEPKKTKRITTVALSSPVATTRSTKVEKMAKVIAKHQLTAGKEKIVKLAKAIGNSKTKVQGTPSKKSTINLQSGSVKKAKQAASPAKRKGNLRPKLETTV